MNRRNPSRWDPQHRSRQPAAGLWLYGLHPVRAALANPHRGVKRAVLTERAAAELPAWQAEHADEVDALVAELGSVKEGRVAAKPRVDAPPEPETLNRLFDHMQSDELILFSTDYPHWQFDGDEVLPKGLSSDLVRKIMIDNPYATYGRLKQTATAV